MDYATQMMVCLTIAREDFELYARLGRRWLTELPQATNPELLHRMRSGDPEVEPGMAVTPWPGGPINDVIFNDENLGQAIAELARPAETVRFGGRTDQETCYVTVSWMETTRMRFVATIANDPAGMDTQVSRLTSFLKDFLDEADPDYGFASTKYFDNMSTELDTALRRRYWDSILQARNLMRGYSWLTVVPKELVARLGGEEAFQSGGFDVHSLTAGGLIVLAASTPEDYDEAAMYRLFEFVSPVLPPGQPKAFPVYDMEVVYKDASSVCR